MNMRIFISLLFFTIIAGACAQENVTKHDKFFCMIEYRQMYTFSMQTDIFSVTGFGPGKGVNNLRLVGSYYLRPCISVGAGISIDNHHILANTPSFPFIVDIRGYLKNKESTPFTYLSGSYSYKSGDFERSYGTNMGIGWRLKLYKKTAVNFSVGYNFINYPDKVYGVFDYTVDFDYYTIVKSTNLHSLSFGLGLSF